MEKLRLIELLKKLQTNRLSTKEQLELKRFVQDEQYAQLMAEVIQTDNLDGVSGPDPKASARMLRNIKNSIPAATSNTRPLRLHRRWISIAAAACILVSFLLYQRYFIKTQHQDYLEQFLASSPIIPGDHRAELLLEDGSKIDLESLGNDTTLQMDGYQIHKNKKGQLSYSLPRGQKKTTIYNTIVTPRGGEYQLQLPDGSRVWINASSKLRYPLQWATESRQIELQGEAFFQVNPKIVSGKSVPFIVQTGEQRLEVLGTSFNINSYEQDILTTLVEGEVKLWSSRSPEKKLAPNQQASFNKARETIVTKSVDPIYAIAWKNGSFAFENNSIQEVMSQLSRWYDVEVDYRNDVSDVRFSGTISRFEQISTVLRLIELTGSVRFQIEGRRIVVMR